MKPQSSSPAPATNVQHTAACPIHAWHFICKLQERRPESRGSVSSFLFPLLQPVMPDPAAPFTGSKTLGSMTSSPHLRFLIPPKQAQCQNLTPKVALQIPGVKGCAQNIGRQSISNSFSPLTFLLSILKRYVLLNPKKLHLVARQQLYHIRK